MFTLYINDFKQTNKFKCVALHKTLFVKAIYIVKCINIKDAYEIFETLLNKSVLNLILRSKCTIKYLNV